MVSNARELFTRRYKTGKGPIEEVRKKFKSFSFVHHDRSATHNNLHLIACHCAFATQQDVDELLFVRDSKVIRGEYVSIGCVYA
jgi:hypothetical protein